MLICQLTQSLDAVFKGKRTSHLNKITIFNLCKLILFVCDFSSARNNLEIKRGTQQEQNQTFMLIFHLHNSRIPNFT